MRGLAAGMLRLCASNTYLLPSHMRLWLCVAHNASQHRTDAPASCAEWGRIEPQKGCFDPAAIAHYHKIFDCLIRCAATGLNTIIGSLHLELAALPAALPKGSCCSRM